MTARWRGRGALSVVMAAFWIVVLATPVAASDAPEPPYASLGDLPAPQSGPIDVEKSGSVAEVSVGGDHTSVFAYVYSSDAEPRQVGPHELEDGGFKVDLLLLPAGEHTVVVLDGDGDTVGWDSMETTAEESTARPESDDGGAPLGWIALAVLVLGGVGWLGWSGRRRFEKEEVI